MAMEETNIAPENRPLEKDIPTGNHRFYGRTVSPREGKFPFAMLDCLRGPYKHESTKRNESNHHDPYGTNKGQISSSFFRFFSKDPFGIFLIMDRLLNKKDSLKALSIH